MGLLEDIVAIEEQPYHRKTTGPFGSIATVGGHWGPSRIPKILRDSREVGEQWDFAKFLG